ncbi:MAG: putative LPS assembly protein LptD, partial [bacterium]
YQEVEDTTGQKVRLDKFRGTPRGKVMSLNYSLTNLFQMKLGKGDKEKKIDLFNLNFSSGYNFAADSLKFSNLTTSFRASPRRNVTVTMGMSHSFYEFDQVLKRTVDRFRAPRLTRMTIDARWQLRGKASQQSEKSQTARSGTAPVTQTSQGQPNQTQDSFAPEGAFSAFDIPWKANIALTYSISRTNPLLQTTNAYIDLSGVEVQLTRGWRIGYRMRYDLEKTEILDQRISFYRDLHCWEARFDWFPSGIGRGFYFKINIKASHLSSIKLEQRGGTTSIFRPF